MIIAHIILISAAAKQCSERYFWELFNNENHQCRKQKACSIFEYDFLFTGYSGSNENQYSFDYVIESPESDAGKRMTEPFKLVRTEFLVWNGLTLLSNIFGAFGLTIGFSLMGAMEWLTDKLAALWVKLKLKRRANASTAPPQVL